MPSSAATWRCRVKRSLWFWGKQAGPWLVWGLWWKQRVFVGVSVIQRGEEWTL